MDAAHQFRSELGSKYARCTEPFSHRTISVCYCAAVKHTTGMEGAAPGASVVEQLRCDRDDSSAQSVKAGVDEVPVGVRASKVVVGSGIVYCPTACLIHDGRVRTGFEEHGQDVRV